MRTCMSFPIFGAGKRSLHIKEGKGTGWISLEPMLPMKATKKNEKKSFSEQTKAKWVMEK